MCPNSLVLPRTKSTVEQDSPLSMGSTWLFLCSHHADHHRFNGTLAEPVSRARMLGVSVPHATIHLAGRDLFQIKRQEVETLKCAI